MTLNRVRHITDFTTRSRVFLRLGACRSVSTFRRLSFCKSLESHQIGQQPDPYVWAVSSTSWRCSRWARFLSC